MNSQKKFDLERSTFQEKSDDYISRSVFNVSLSEITFINQIVLYIITFTMLTRTCYFRNWLNWQIRCLWKDGTEMGIGKLTMPMYGLETGQIQGQITGL